jgi:hypothetical protein
VITLCNNQLLDLVEKRLIWAFGHVPGVLSVLPSLATKLKTVKNKFLSAPVTASTSIAVKVWILLPAHVTASASIAPSASLVLSLSLKWSGTGHNYMGR